MSAAKHGERPRSGSGLQSGQRLLSMDWMRGFVMVLMAIDHASQTWNAGRLNADSAYLLDPSSGLPAWAAGSALPLDQFLTRWITHLCAPTFLFLAGAALALSAEKRAAAGESPGAIDRHLLIRALVILGFEGLLSYLADFGALMLQVLFAIGMSLLVMIPLRRLSSSWLLGGALAWFVGGELLCRALVPVGAPAASLPEKLLFVASYEAPVMVLYPFVHWLAIMALGWVFGRHLLALPAEGAARLALARRLALAGASGLLLFLVLRGLDGYGNMGLHRDDASLAQWLHVSKYPPALAFLALELGLMALCLAAFLRYEVSRRDRAWHGNPLLVFGQTALFFYVLHFALLGGGALAISGGLQRHGLAETYLAAAAVLVALYPVCLGYRAFKRRHPRSFAQYV